MVFNWFNRFRKDEKKDEPAPEEAAQPGPPPAPEVAEVKAEPDFMELAKAYYNQVQSAPAPETSLQPVPEAVSDWQSVLYGNASSPPAPPVEPPITESAAPPPVAPPIEVRRPVEVRPVEPILPPVIEPVLPPPIEAVQKAPELSQPPVPPVPPVKPPVAPAAAPLPEPQPAPAFDWRRILYGRPTPTPEPEVQTPPVEPVAEIPAPAPQAEPPAALSEPTPTAAPEPEPPPAPAFDWRRILYNANRPPTPPPVEETRIDDKPQPSPTPEPTPEIAFDAGFLWSAEVLAAQGRRPEDVTAEEITWLQKLRFGLGRTRRGLVNSVKAVVGRGPIGEKELEELEEILLQADVGLTVSERVLAALQAQVRKQALAPDQVLPFLKAELRKQLELEGDDPTKFAPTRDVLNVWLIVGVNGVGKTTTIGKIAALATRSGYDTLIAAGDTFRAAAVEQLKIWGDRSGVQVIANPSPKADPAAVAFDAIRAAQSRNVELLLVDTAGRLQNKQNLMDELAKVRRTIDKQAAGAQVESLLVLDATTGQNGLQQAKVFAQTANLTGVVLTKLDGSSKGGIALAIVNELKLPIRFVGVGEKIDDLRPFNSYEFIEALLSDYEV